MKITLAGLLTLVSASAFSMDLETFATDCPAQMAKLTNIEEIVEAHYHQAPQSEIKFAEGSVILASARGFILEAYECKEVEYNISEILMVMKKLKIK